MKYSAVFLAALASPISAAVVTQVVHVTQYVYQQVDVYADEDGNPVSTNIQYVSTSLSGDAAPVAATTQTFSTDAATTVAPTTTEAAPTTTTTPAAASPTTTEAAATTSTAAPVPTTTSETTTAAAETTSETSVAGNNNYLYTKETSQEPATTSTTPEAETTTAAPTTSVAAVETTSSSSAAAPVETTSSSSAAAPAETSSSSSSSSSSGSDTYSGEATYYDPGLGACGITNSAADLIAALNVEQMGAQSNGNPVCGKKAQINYNGKSVIVTITDKCPGCSYGDLDLSPAAFDQLADESVGRIKMTWSYL